MWRVEPAVLEGRSVRLEPLAPVHVPGLCEVGLDPEIWRWTTSIVDTPEAMRRYVDTALREHAEGSALPFAIRALDAGCIVGSTRFAAMQREHRKVEIGWSWIAPPWQRTAVNTETKYLLLRHAFEALGCFRVELKTDALNERSRRAILRIGAREEGVLRSHMLLPDGRRRDTVYFSILDHEWPAVRTALEARLAPDTA